METKHFFNHTRGASYTDFDRCTDTGIKAWGKLDLEKRLAQEAAVLGPIAEAA